MLDEIGVIIAGLGGLGGFISILVNILKMIGWVKDGEGGKWTNLLNLVAFLAVTIIYFIQVPIDWGMINEYLRLFAFMLGFVAQIWTADKTYEKVRGTPVIGYSHSLNE